MSRSFGIEATDALLRADLAAREKVVLAVFTTPNNRRDTHQQIARKLGASRDTIGAAIREAEAARAGSRR